MSNKGCNLDENEDYYLCLKTISRLGDPKEPKAKKAKKVKHTCTVWYQLTDGKHSHEIAELLELTVPGLARQPS